MSFLRQMTSNRTNQGLASMPAQGRSPPVDGRGQGADQSYGERRYADPVARQAAPQDKSQPQYRQAPPPAAPQEADWDDSDWDHEHDEAAGHRARRLLSRPT